MEGLKCDLCNMKTNDINDFSCEHQTCKDCFYKICLFNKHMIETYYYQTEKVLNLKCAICSSGTIAISKHQLRIKLIENAEKKEKEKQKLCTYHKKELSIYCSECKIQMCPECFKSHKKVRMFKSHEPGKSPAISSSLLNICGKHDNRPFHYFCAECNCALCEICKSNHKHEHKVRFLQKFFNEKKEEFGDQFVMPPDSAEEISKRMDESDKALKEELNKEVAGMKDKINTIINFLNEKSRHLEKELKIICEEMDTNNVINKNLYKNLVRDLDNVSKSTEFDINCQYLIKIPRDNRLSDREITRETITLAIDEMNHTIEKFNKSTGNKTTVQINNKLTELPPTEIFFDDTQSIAISQLNEKELMSQVNEKESISQVGKGESTSPIIEKEWNPHRYGKRRMTLAMQVTEKDYAMSLIQILTGLGSVYSLIQLKDGRLATCSSDKTIRIWDPEDNFNCTHTLKGHTYSVSSLLQFNDGRIASGSGDKTIRIWDPQDNFKCTDTLTGNTYLVYSLIQLKDGRLASGSFDNSIKIWDPQDNFKCCQSLTGHRNLVYSLVQLQDGGIASGSRDNTIKIWDYQDNFKCSHNLKGHTDSVKVLIQLKDGRVASGSWDNTVRIWDPQDNYNCIHTLTGHTSSVYSLIQFNDGRIASGSLDNTIRIWDPQDNFNCTQTLTGHTDSVSCIIQIQDGRLVSGSWDNTLRIWK